MRKKKGGGGKKRDCLCCHGIEGLSCPNSGATVGDGWWRACRCAQTQMLPAKPLVCDGAAVWSACLDAAAVVARALETEFFLQLPRIKLNLRPRCLSVLQLDLLDSPAGLCYGLQVQLEFFCYLFKTGKATQVSNPPQDDLHLKANQAAVISLTSPPLGCSLNPCPDVDCRGSFNTICSISWTI